MSAASPDSTPAAATLEFRDVVKHYPSAGDTIRAVDGVSLAVDAGELVALFGPSGSGKSTLLMIAAAVLRPDHGGVFVDGNDVSALNEREAARYRKYEIGFVRQSVELLGGASVVDNASLKLWSAGYTRKAAKREVTGILDQLGLSGRLHHRPDQLSMGERQRVMIARALSLTPKVLLADEPTGSLDSKRTHEVLDLLRSTTKDRGIASLLVTHDSHAVEYADRVYTLEDGLLRETGPPPPPSAP